MVNDEEDKVLSSWTFLCCAEFASALPSKGKGLFLASSIILRFYWQRMEKKREKVADGNEDALFLHEQHTNHHRSLLLRTAKGVLSSNRGSLC